MQHRNMALLIITIVLFISMRLSAVGAAAGELLEAARHYLPGQRINCVVTADFNLDGHLDLAGTDWTTDQPGLWVLPGDGSGEYPQSVFMPLGQRPWYLVVPPSCQVSTARVFGAPKQRLGSAQNRV